MRHDVLHEMHTFITNHLPHIRSVLVVKDGYLVFEEYYQGVDEQDAYPIASATKTFTAILTGIAIEQGYIPSVDFHISPFFEEQWSPDMDEVLHRVTVEHLLTMSAGWAWSDNRDERRCLASQDAIACLFRAAFAAEPGTTFTYNTMCSYLLSAMITKTTQVPASDFAREVLFAPLGIESASWPQHQGHTLGGHSLRITARDMAKFGYLLLRKGQWEGTQLVSEAWIDTCITQHNAGGRPHGAQYGYHLWLTSYAGYPVFFAGGYGGQFILVVPELDIVTVIKSNFDRHHEENRDLVERYIIPAVILKRPGANDERSHGGS
jgi:CubicO group peptidase (beta-lactamase class C family)